VITVDELINPVNGTSVPITQGREDLVAWHQNRTGMFSVRSTYIMESGNINLDDTKDKVEQVR
jgi:hypothetical protein